MAKDIDCAAVVNNPDGSLFYKETHTWTNCDEEMEAAIYDMLDKQKQFLDKEKENQRKEPKAIFSAVLSATGLEDLYYDAFTYDMVQKATHNWNQLGEKILRMGEKRVKGKK